MSFRVKNLIAIGLLGAAVVTAAPAAAQARSYHFNIQNEPLSQALRDYGQISGQEIIFTEDVLAGSKPASLKGEFTAATAIIRLLNGTGLTAEVSPSGALMIRKPQAQAAADRTSYNESAATQSAGRFAQTDSANNAANTESANSANSSSASSKENARNTVQEIIVTATKRQERVQDVPMSIAVIGNQDIERRGLIGMEDYLRGIPGVNQIDQGVRDNGIIIRGITTTPTAENFRSGPSVGTYFGESPISGAAGRGAGGIDVRPVDIERIEVLRGPQGTAYGSGSLSGTLRIIPVAPKLDGFTAKLAASYSDTSGNGSENSMIQGIFNIPIVEDRLALRAVGYRYDDSGFYRNIAGIDPATIAFASNYGLGDYVRGHVEDDVGHMLTTGGRVAALWQATDKLSLSMNFLTQKIEQDGRPQDAAIGTVAYEQARIPIAPQGRQRGESGEIADNDMDLLNAVVNYDLGWAALTSTVSRIDSGTLYSVSVGTEVPFLGLTSHLTGSDFKSISAEMRLVSQLEGRFQFLGGLFYENTDEDYFGLNQWPGTQATNPFGTNPLSDDQVQRQLDQRAVFGEVSYDLSEKLKATVGGRFFEYDKDEHQLSSGALFGTPLGGATLQTRKSSESDSSFKANLSYQPTKDSLLYASWAQGFRLGKPEAGGPRALCDPNNDGVIDGTSLAFTPTIIVNSDTLDNYEIGAKFALFDRRIVVDAAVYHIDWKGLPVRTVVGTACQLTINAGGATSDGVELQATVQVTEGVRLDFGGGYTNAELSRDVPTLLWRDGDLLPGSPKVTANLAAQYDFGIAGHKAFVRADSFYTGEFYGTPLRPENTRAGDYIKVDGRAGVKIRNLSVELFVRNITDEDAYTSRGALGGGFRLRPRTVGIQVGYDFE